MNRIFGKKRPTEPAPSLTEVEGQSEQRLHDLNKKIKELDEELRPYRKALANKRGQRREVIERRAVEILRRKKAYERQRDQLTGQQFNVAQIAFSIESVEDTKRTVAAMKNAKETLQKATKKNFTEDTEELMDDLEFLMEEIGEATEGLGRPIGVPEGVTEEDLNDELELLDLEEEEGNILEGVQPATLPSEPAVVPVSLEPTGVDDFGLPVAPTSPKPAAQTEVRV